MRGLCNREKICFGFLRNTLFSLLGEMHFLLDIENDLIYLDNKNFDFFIEGVGI